MKPFVYADNAATTQISDAVLNGMLPYLKESFGNASSVYSIGRQAKTALEQARQQVADALGAGPGELYFTSGGTEANNWAIKGAAWAQAKRGKKHIITSRFEHHAVLHTVDSLKKEGFTVSYVDVNRDGVILPQDVEALIQEDTALVSIMYANNEIGTIQPIDEIGTICRKHGVLFHTDAVQAVGYAEINLQNQNIDLLSLSGHKIRAQKGVGALYIRKGVVIHNLLDGGGQEKRKRSGTENVAAIVGLGIAITQACADIQAKNQRLRSLQEQLIDGMLSLPNTRLNGNREKRLPGNVNISFEGIEGEGLLLMLDMKGICASSGSACTSGSLDPSHVLLSIGLEHEIAHGSLRLSINEATTQEDVDYMLECIPPIVQRLRDMSPLWEQIVARQSCH